jgi:hypothetical protein
MDAEVDGLIDWLFVARNALWIVGLAIAGAAWSYTSWWAAVRRVRLRHALGLALFQVPFASGMLMFTASLAWGATRWWERVLWSLLALAFALQAATDWRWARAHGWDAARSPANRATFPAHSRAGDGAAD